jgi:hypothetical protein
MEEVWRSAITHSLNRFFEKVFTFLPNLLAMITILIIGFIMAWVVKKLVFRFLQAIQFDKTSVRWGLGHIESKGGLSLFPSNILSRFFYWIIVLITLILGINALDVPATQNLIAHFFNYLPHFFAALLVLAVGYLLAAFLGQAALIASVNAQMEFAKPISRAVRWFIMILSLTMALYHLGIAEKVIIAAFTITMGGIVLAAAIAFGWGGRELAKELLEKRYGKGAQENPKKDQLSHI